MIKEKQTSNFLKYKGKNIIRNNPIKHFLIFLFFRRIYQEIRKINPQTLIDLGCGEGFLEKYLREKNFNIKMTAVDINPMSLEYARKNITGVKFINGDILNLKIRGNFDLVVMLEVLEHLSFPEKSLKKAQNLSKKILVSVPWEPYFSWLYLLVGLNFKKRGKHPEHCQFFNRQSLEKLLKKYYKIVDVKANWPWLIGFGQN